MYFTSNLSYEIIPIVSLLKASFSPSTKDLNCGTTLLTTLCTFDMHQEVQSSRMENICCLISRASFWFEAKVSISMTFRKGRIKPFIERNKWE